MIIIMFSNHVSVKLPNLPLITLKVIDENNTYLIKILLRRNSFQRQYHQKRKNLKSLIALLKDWLQMLQNAFH